MDLQNDNRAPFIVARIEFCLFCRALSFANMDKRQVPRRSRIDKVFGGPR